VSFRKIGAVGAAIMLLYILQKYDRNKHCLFFKGLFSICHCRA